MSTQILADWLCALGKDVHLLLRDVQRDADRDPRFASIERQLASLLHDVDRRSRMPWRSRSHEPARTHEGLDLSADEPRAASSASSVDLVLRPAAKELIHAEW
jgi:hypothetical protein